MFQTLQHKYPKLKKRELITQATEYFFKKFPVSITIGGRSPAAGDARKLLSKTRLWSESKIQKNGGCPYSFNFNDAILDVDMGVIESYELNTVAQNVEVLEHFWHAIDALSQKDKCKISYGYNLLIIYCEKDVVSKVLSLIQNLEEDTRLAWLSQIHAVSLSQPCGTVMVKDKKLARYKYKIWLNTNYIFDDDIHKSTGFRKVVSSIINTYLHNAEIRISPNAVNQLNIHHKYTWLNSCYIYAESDQIAMMLALNDHKFIKKIQQVVYQP